MQSPMIRSSLDPFSKAFFDDPYPAHHALREAGPLVWLETLGCWGAARYSDVHVILHDWQTFCSSRGAGLSDFAHEKPWRPPSLVLEADPPAHTQTRAILNRALSASVIKGLRIHFADVALTKVRALMGRSSFDAIADLAVELPMAVFPDAIGLRQQGREHLLPYGGLAFNAFGPDNALRREALARATPHIAWVTEQCERENLRDDGIGSIIHAAVDTGEITRATAVLLVRSLLTAGIDTTVNGLGALLWCLATNPDQWLKLKVDSTLARSAFDEALRLESPVQTFFRTTTRAGELSGAHYGEGEKVLMFLASANRDPRKWERPDDYDITRSTLGHVAYGNGVHMCVGQLLARIEAEALISALVAEVESIQIVGLPTRAYNNTLRGLEHLPMRFE